MSKTYIIFAIVLLAVAFGLVLLPNPDHRDEMNPESLLQKINNPSRFLSPDQIAERIIDEDPTLMIIDVRDEDAFANFSLPGAYNIPLEQITDPQWEDYFGNDDMDLIFYSNGDVKADQAWIISTRLNYQHLYVMEGGINGWFKNIMQPTPPPSTASSKEYDQYTLRLAASQFFGGGSQLTTASGKKVQAIPLVKRKKKVVSEGGC